MSASLLDKWTLANAALTDPDLSVGAAAVLARLLWHFNAADRDREHRCFPSYEKLAADLGFKKRHTICLAQELQARGWIIIERRHSERTGQQTSNSFRILFDRARSLDEGAAQCTPLTGEGAPQCTPGVHHSTSLGVHHNAPEIGNTNKGTEHSPFGGEKQSARKAKGPTEEEVQSALDLLKVSYPKRPAPKWSKTRSRLAAILRRGVSPDLLAAKAREYGQQCARERREPQFIQQPDTWLNQEGWTLDYAPVPKAAADRPTAAFSDTQWIAFVSDFRRGGSWPQALGPSPGSAGCRVPPHILRDTSAKAAA